MRSLINTILVCAATLGSLSVAQAMPAALNLAPSSATATVGGAQVDKVVVIVRKRVIVRRPRRVVVKRIIVR